MRKASKIAIVIPCFNEALRLRCEIFTQFLRQHSEIRLVLVDDGSTDQTLAILEQLRDQSPSQIKVVALPSNSGKAEAVRQGVIAALDCQPQPECFGYWDADLATPLNAICQFAEVLERRPDIDQVFGTRMTLSGHSINRDTGRRWPGRFFSAVASCVLGHRFVDTQCGAKLFRTTPLTTEIFSDPFITRWVFDVELLARQINLLNDQEKFQESIFEFPLERWDEIPGSKLRLHNVVTAAWELLRIYVHYLSPFCSQPRGSFARDLSSAELARNTKGTGATTAIPVEQVGVAIIPVATNQRAA